MKRIALTFIIIIAVGCICLGQDFEFRLSVEDSLAFADAGWETTKLGKGAEAIHAQFRIFDSMQDISIIRYPARKFKTRFGHYPSEEAGKTSELAVKAGVQMAINAGYFDKGPVPCVYFRIGEEVYAETKPKEAQLRVNAVVGFKDRKGRKMMIRECDATQYDEVTSDLHSVMASGPLLMQDGLVVVPESYSKAYPERKTGGFYDGRHPRSIIGSDDKGHIYLIVIDGRHKDQAEGTTIYQTALICYLLGLDDAINLDGGGSSALWCEDLGVLNHPSDNKKFDHNGERKIPNIIGVTR